MKERPMRWVLSSPMDLAPAPPALSAVRHDDHPMIRNFQRSCRNALAAAAPAASRLLLAYGLLGGLFFPAFAGDFDLPVLRGSDPVALPVAAPTFRVVSPTATYRWAGFYGGIQGGYSGSAINLGTAEQPIAYILRETAIEQDQHISRWPVFNASASATSASLGGFAGYNTEWENAVILGLEVNYNHVSLSAASAGSIARSFIDSTNLPTGHHYLYNVSVTGQASVHMSDIATFRARAGWELNTFLPYAFVGFATGRAQPSTSATVSSSAVDYPDSQTPPITPLPPLQSSAQSQTYGSNGNLAVGVAAGVGTDVALTPNVFLRGEFEYIYFAETYGVQISIVTGRVGAGFKF
jgi:outer membrane immunogenic protein